MKMSNEPVGYLEEIHDRAYRSGFIAGRDSERTDTPNVELKKDYQQFGTAIYTHPSQEWISVNDRLPSGIVLACYETEHSKKPKIVRAIYCKKHTVEAGSDDEFFEYDEESDSYYLPEGWYERIDFWDDYSSVFINSDITHWMPLPTPPKEQEK